MRVCDLCRGSEGLKMVRLVVESDSTPNEHTPPAPDLGEAELCAPCRARVKDDGLVVLLKPRRTRKVS